MAVVDSAGTTDCGRRCPGVFGDRTSEARSDLTAMNLLMCAINAPRLAPIGVEFDGRSLPSLEVEHRR